MKRKKILKDFIIFFFLLLSVASYILPNELNNLDELWNYNFARNIYEGKLPYKDFNMIQTPLLPIICGLILKIFGNELIVIRVLGVLLNTAILFLVYKILEVLKLNKYYILAIMLGVFALFCNYFCMDYNFAVLLIILLIIYIEIKNIIKKENVIETSNIYNFLLGILAGSTILFKQTTGIAISIVFAFYIILLGTNKKEIKQLIKTILARGLGVCIPIILFIIYLVLNNIWQDFINYAILGIATFSNKIPYYYLILHYEFPVKVFSLVLPIMMIYVFFKNIVIKNKTLNQKIITVLFSYSIASFIVVFPISDSIHFLIGSMPMLILFFFEIYLFGKKRFQEKKDIIFDYLKKTTKIIAALMIVLSITMVLNYLIYCEEFTELNHFKYIPYSENLKAKINEIDEYIKQKENENINVYILDSTASIYMIPINKYNKDYDMFLNGNLGVDGEQGQIEKLSKETNSIVLIMNENYSRNWQNPENVRKYIIENWTKIGEISNFDIYQKMEEHEGV